MKIEGVEVKESVEIIDVVSPPQCGWIWRKLTKY
jgi:hypothetical protein